MKEGVLIKTPRGQLVQTEAGEFALEWAPGFEAGRQQTFISAQEYVDSEVLRRCEPYLPFRDGILRDSGVLATETGSGVVQYATPYAARLYYHPEYHFSTAKHEQAGGEWFERMKQADKGDILRGAARLTGAEAQE